MISSKTSIYGVMGTPIIHSLSPQIHNFSARCLDIDAVYVALNYQSDCLETTLKTLWNVGIKGLNITVPLKESVASLFSDSKLPSVNTLVRTDLGWKPFSTDGLGFINSANNLISLREINKLVILGNGGAALALSIAWQKYYPNSELVVLRRNVAKDDNFLRLVPDTRFLPMTSDALEQEISSGNVLLVQATSAPLHGDDLGWLCAPLSRLSGGFIDMLYGGYESALFKKCNELGLRCYNGIGMLVGQALESQKLWWSKSANYELVMSELQK